MTNAIQKETTLFYIELMQSIQSSLEKSGVKQDKAALAAKAARDQIRQEMGGFQIYIPVAREIDICTRNASIHCDFNGSNVRELARSYGLSLQYVYRILKESPKKVEGLKS